MALKSTVGQSKFALKYGLFACFAYLFHCYTLFSVPGLHLVTISVQLWLILADFKVTYIIDRYDVTAVKATQW